MAVEYTRKHSSRRFAPFLQLFRSLSPAFSPYIHSYASMKLTADALGALGSADDTARAKVAVYVAELARVKPAAPPHVSTPAQSSRDERSSPSLQPRSPRQNEEKENAQPDRAVEKRSRAAEDQDQRDKQERLEERKKRKAVKATMTREPKTTLAALLGGKKLKKGLSSDGEESDDAAPKKRRKSHVDMLAPMAGRHGHNVGQGRITSKPGFLNMGLASEPVRTGKRQAKPLPDLAFNELEFLNKSGDRHADEEGHSRKRQKTTSAAQHSKHFAHAEIPTTDDRSRRQGGDEVVEHASRALSWAPSHPGHHTAPSQPGQEDISSRTKSPTSAHSLKQRREQTIAPSEPGSRFMEQPPGLVAAMQAARADRATPQQLRRSQSAPQSRPVVPSPPRGEPGQAQSAHAEPLRNFYSDGIDLHEEPSPRRAMSAGTVESLRDAARQSSREQHIFLADITAFHPWAPEGRQCTAEPIRHDGDPSFTIHEDVHAEEWPTLDIQRETEFDEYEAFPQNAEYAETVVDDELLDSFVDQYVEEDAFAQPNRRPQTSRSEMVGFLPPPSWLRSPVAVPRQHTPPPIPQRKWNENDAPAATINTDEMRSWWWRARP